jgi:hypothetical protein
MDVIHVTGDCGTGSRALPQHPMPVRAFVMGKSMRNAIIAIVALAAGILLMYYKSHGVQSRTWGTFLSFGYGALAVLLSKKLNLSPKGATDVPFPGIQINFRALAKAAGCLVAMIVWIFIALSLVSNTTAGMIVLLVPCFIFGTAAVFFFSRSY